MYIINFNGSDTPNTLTAYATKNTDLPAAVGEIHSLYPDLSIDQIINFCTVAEINTREKRGGAINDNEWVELCKFVRPSCQIIRLEKEGEELEETI